MACYKPIVAWKPLEGGAVSFRELKNHREIALPCGQCIGCRIQKRDNWAARCMAEAAMHKSNHFVTLTYDDDHLPPFASLRYKDVQLFLKRARKEFGPFRFLVAGEYGDETKRPHYHGLFFGLDLPDRCKSNSVYSSYDLYKSERLEKCWGQGNTVIGEVTFESARYTAAYVVKKKNYKNEEAHYMRVDQRTGEIGVIAPEFARMSLKPGIGLTWLQKYYKDLYSAHDAMIVNGRKVRIPDFFELKMEEINPILLEDSKARRAARVNHENNTRARLEVREQCALAREKFNKEGKSNAL